MDLPRPGVKWSTVEYSGVGCDIMQSFVVSELDWGSEWMSVSCTVWVASSVDSRETSIDES